jgi:hypothetical protein
VAEVENPYGRHITGEGVRPPLAVGMWVEAAIAGHRFENIFRVPNVAVRGHDRVLVVDGEGRLRLRPVEILRTERDEVLVRGGLEPGVRVCLSPIAIVVEGMAVTAEEVR